MSTCADSLMQEKRGFAFLEASFTMHAQLPFLILESGEVINYGQFWQQANRYASRLVELGMKPCDRLLIRLTNSEHFLLLYLACAMGGFTACPIDPAFPESRVDKIKKMLSPSYVCEDGNTVEWTASPSRENLTCYPSGSEPDFLVILSSGTTGEPKGIVHTITSIVESARSFARLADHDEHTVVYHHLPMYYMAGVFNMFFCPAVSGSRIVLGPRFSGAQMLKFWIVPQRFGVNHLTLTPTMAQSLAQLYRHDDNLLEHLAKYEGIISTSSMLYSSVAERFHKTFGVPIRSCYGVTEVGGSITLQNWESAIAMESVGTFEPEVSIIAGDDPETPVMVKIKTPFMMRGYLVNGDVINAFDDDGYFNTGDLGYVKGNELYITGRENDIVKKGGEFVPLAMLENIALNCSGVAEVAAVAVPDDFWGNKIVLFYVPEVTQGLDEIEQNLFKMFDQQLRNIEHPDKVIPVPCMPKTSIGKTIKRELIKRYTI